MTCSIFIRTYQKDFEWLTYCLRSVHKFARGFSEIVIAVPKGQEAGLRHLTAERIVLVHDAQPGYLGQQHDKLNADIHTRADFVLHFDSDMIFTAPVTPEFFLHQGKPVWVVTPFDEAAEDEKKQWLHVMVKCLREMPPFEFMRRGAIICPSFAYVEFRAFIERVHKQSMPSYVMNQPGHEFSEYNCLGFFNWLYHRDKFHWHNTATDGVPEWPFKQYWSYGGLSQDIRNQMEIALA